MSRNSNRLLFKYGIMKKVKPARIEDDLDTLAREFNKEPLNSQGQDKERAGAESDSSDEFGVFDPLKHVSFDEKVKLSDLLKKCSREKLTKVVQIL